MTEKRRHERIEACLEIKVIRPGEDDRTVVTKDFSDGGAFVVWSPAPSLEGGEIFLQLNSMVMGKEPPRLRVRVVRVTDEGVAFEFLSDDPPS